MKKTQFNKLVLNKKTVSSFNVQSIKGGTGLTGACGPNTDEVSACLPCLEDPTEGCGGTATRFGCVSIECFTGDCTNIC